MKEFRIIRPNGELINMLSVHDELEANRIFLTYGLMNPDKKYRLEWREVGEWQC